MLKSQFSNILFDHTGISQMSCIYLISIREYVARELEGFDATAKRASKKKKIIYLIS